MERDREAYAIKPSSRELKYREIQSRAMQDVMGYRQSLDVRLWGRRAHEDMYAERRLGTSAQKKASVDRGC